MDIELVGENQIRVDIKKEDLIERNLKITEIAYGGDKAREFFREIMEIAFEQYGFDVDNVPIVVEAVPKTAEHISILVTKIVDPNELEKRMNKLSTEKAMKKNLEDMLEKVAKKTLGVDKNDKEDKNMIYNKDNILIFGFEEFDSCALACKRINDFSFSRETLILSNEIYYLILELKKDSNENDNVAVYDLLCEYGRSSLMPNIESYYYLLEHGEMIIKKDAVKILAYKI